MRIISGKHKGRRITAPKNLPVRPTTDQAREGLFNILTNRYDFRKLSVLDLFSGTGILSYEFSSRGVQDIVAVDKEVNCLRFINKTANDLDLDILTQKKDVFRFLQSKSKEYDLIFADPPYDFTKDLFEELVKLVFQNEFLKEHGVFILEHSEYMEFSNMKNFRESRKYGGSVFSFFESL